MADQASVSRTNGTSYQASPASLVSNIAEFGNDVATLVELQAKLAVFDAKDCVGRATIPLVVLGVGATFALATLPVILLGIADLIAAATGLSPGGARLLVGVFVLVLAAVVAVISLKAATASLDSFRRTREELTRNISWIRTVLVHSGRGVSRPRM